MGACCIYDCFGHIPNEKSMRMLILNKTHDKFKIKSRLLKPLPIFERWMLTGDINKMKIKYLDNVDSIYMQLSKLKPIIDDIKEKKSQFNYYKNKGYISIARDYTTYETIRYTDYNEFLNDLTKLYEHWIKVETLEGDERFCYLYDLEYKTDEEKNKETLENKIYNYDLGDANMVDEVSKFLN